MQNGRIKTRPALTLILLLTAMGFDMNLKSTLEIDVDNYSSSGKIEATLRACLDFILQIKIPLFYF